MSLHSIFSRMIAATPVANLPVRVRDGLAKGANWTLFPFSANWRAGGGEKDVIVALRYLDSIQGAVFWDFGAHFGIHTVGVAMQVGPSGQVVAFEPDPNAFTKLERHVRMNNLGNVRLYRAAVSSSSGVGKLFFPNGVKGSSNSHFRFYPENDMRGTPFATVETISPDVLVTRREIRLPHLIKVDVQGHGAAAIAGSIQSIKRSQPIIAFSNHSPAELAGSRALLEDLGYKPVDLSGNALAWSDVTESILIPNCAQGPFSPRRENIS